MTAQSAGLVEKDSLARIAYDIEEAAPDLESESFSAFETAMRWAERIRALSAPAADGVLVPRVPTPEMDAAGKRALADNGVDSVDTSDALLCYAAMLAAAPQAQGEGK